MKNFKLHIKLIAILSALFPHFLISNNEASAQWTKTSGPPGINVNTFFNKGPYLFAGTSSKGVFRSSDSGVTWTVTARGLENATVLSFAKDGDYLYAGTNKGVFRSSNNGLIWTAANTGIEGQLVTNMVIGGGFLFAGTAGLGVYRSQDQGVTWKNANGGALDFSSIYAMCYVNNVLIVEADNYLFKSSNAGRTWFVDQGSTAFFVIKHFLVLGDTLLASARNGIFRSYDGGLNWTKFQPLTKDETVELLGFTISNGTIYTADRKGMYKTVDTGRHWISIASIGLRFGNRFNNYFIQRGNTFLIGLNELGVFRSADEGRSWTQSITGFPPAASVDNGMISMHDTIVAGLHSDGVYRTVNNGNAWKKIDTRFDRDTLSNAAIYALLNPAPNIILAGTCGDGLYRSTNNGKTWKHIIDGLPYISTDNYECDFGLTKSGRNVLLATTNGIYYSTNNGLSWKSSNLTGDRISASSIAANGNIAVAGVSMGVFPFKSGVYRSVNSGVTWTFALSLFDDFIALASDGIDHFYAGGFFGNYRSTNNGLSWNTMGTGIPDNTGGFTVKVVDTTNIFIGNNKGIYFSNNRGNSFSDVSNGLDPEPNNAVQGLIANSRYLFAGLDGNGIWRRPLSDFGITSASDEQIVKSNTHDKSELNEQTVLYISPNPAKNKANILLTTTASGKVQLTITDQLGKTVVRSAEFLSAGNYNKIVDVKQFSPGIYFVQVTVNGKTNTTKLMVVR